MLRRTQPQRAIRDLMRPTWVEHDPTKRCFDFDEDRMEVPLACRDRRATPAQVEDVRAHLLVCIRCRFLYGQLRRLR